MAIRKITEATPFFFEDRFEFSVMQVRCRRVRPSPVVTKKIALNLNQSVALIVNKPAADRKIDNGLGPHAVEFEVKLTDRRVYLKPRIIGTNLAPECAKMRN